MMLGVWAWVPPPVLKGVVHVILRMYEVSELQRGGFVMVRGHGPFLAQSPDG